jgi:hypothetical protein
MDQLQEGAIEMEMEMSCATHLACVVKYYFFLLKIYAAPLNILEKEMALSGE